MSKKNRKKSLLSEGEMRRWKELTGQKDAYDPDFWLAEGDYKEKMDETPPQDMKQKYLEEEELSETPPQDMKQKYLEEEEELEEAKGKKPKAGKVDHSHPDHKLQTVKEGEDIEEQDLDEMVYRDDKDEEPMMEDDDDLDDMGGDDMPPMDDEPEMDMGGEPEMDMGGGEPSVEQALQDLISALKSELAAGEDIDVQTDGGMDDEMDMGGDDMPPMDNDEDDMPEKLAEHIEKIISKHERSLTERVAKKLRRKKSK